MYNESPGEKLRLLLIEDDPDDYVMVRDMLSGAVSGYEIVWVNTYDGAVSAVRETHDSSYDLYLIDYQLGQHSGLELIHEIRTIDCRIPIILLTGYGSYEIDMKAMKAGFSDYLDKSEITPAMLERTIHHAIERKKSEMELKRFQESLEQLVKERTKELLEERDRLQAALDNIKTLEGLLPICAWCRKIRNDQGYWMQLEDYFIKNSDLQFSHGICPECRKAVEAEGT